MLKNSKTHEMKLYTRKENRDRTARKNHITHSCIDIEFHNHLETPKIDSTISPDRVDRTESRVSLNWGGG